MIWAIIVFMIVQLIDNNFLVPKVIASRVKLNALISIVGVLIGGSLCGVGGMFLSIPFIAICKVIFDRVKDLQPWGKLLGDDIPVANLRHVLKKGVKIAPVLNSRVLMYLKYLKDKGFFKFISLFFWHYVSKPSKQTKLLNLSLDCFGV